MLGMGIMFFQRPTACPIEKKFSRGIDNNLRDLIFWADYNVYLKILNLNRKEFN